MINRIKRIVVNYHIGLLDSSDDAAQAILETIPQPTERMCQLGAQNTKK